MTKNELIKELLLIYNEAYRAVSTENNVKLSIAYCEEHNIQYGLCNLIYRNFPSEFRNSISWINDNIRFMETYICIIPSKCTIIEEILYSFKIRIKILEAELNN